MFELVYRICEIDVVESLFKLWAIGLN